MLKEILYREIQMNRKSQIEFSQNSHQNINLIKSIKKLPEIKQEK
jgi:hypothetical protein